MTTLIVNDSESLCGLCLQPADPTELLHATILAYERGTGCMTRFTEIGTTMGWLPAEAFAELRPDLPFIGVVDYNLTRALVN